MELIDTDKMRFYFILYKLLWECVCVDELIIYKRKLCRLSSRHQVVFAVVEQLSKSRPEIVRRGVTEFNSTKKKSGVELKVFKLLNLKKWHDRKCCVFSLYVAWQFFAYQNIIINADRAKSLTCAAPRPRCEQPLTHLIRSRDDRRRV